MKFACKTVCLILGLLLATSLSAKTPAQKSNKELVFGILPFLSPVVLIKRFTPLKDYLERVTGKDIYIESAPNFAEFLKRTTSRQYDIIFTAPHFVPVTLEDNHYELLAASNRLAAHFIVKGNSKLTDIRQLAGKRIALGPRQAFVVVIAKYYLKTAGLKGSKAPVYSYYKSHNATLRALEFGDADVAVIGSYLLATAKSRSYRQLGRTNYYPGAVFIVSRSIPEKMRAKIRSAFINIKRTADGRKTLKLIKFPGFQPTRKEEYEPLRNISQDAKDLRLFESTDNKTKK